MSSAIRDILKPRTVAIIGASRDPSKRGYRAIEALFRQGYGGIIAPINPKEAEILGLPCYPNLAAVPHEIDTALVCTPSHAAPAVIAECGEKGVKGAILLAGGFGEASEAGAELEARTIAVAKRYGVRLIGPNTNGIFDAHTGMNLVGWPGIYKGRLGILSQSGNVGLSLLSSSAAAGEAGLTTFVGVGNESDIAFDEYLRYFGEDEETRAVIVYAEGFRNAAAFVDAAREVTPVKPVVLYKAGRTQQGQGAARSHSGSLAGDYAVGKAAMQQAGIVVVERSDEMFAVADALSHHAGRPALRVGILSEGGGVISQAADALADRGLQIPRVEPGTEATLKTISPNASQLFNPVDYGGATDPHPRYLAPCTRAILADPNIDAMLSVGYAGAYQCRNNTEAIREGEKQAAIEMVAASREFGKPIVLQNHYAEANTEALQILRAGGVVVVRSIEVAAACLAGIEAYHQARRRQASAAPSPTPAPAAGATEIIAAARAVGRTALTEPEALGVLRASGIAVPPFAVIRDPAEAARLPASLTVAPAAIKIVSPDILHKSDVGGVRLGLSGAAAIADAAGGMLAAIRASQPGAALTGVLVTPMAERGVEVILGVTTDPQYGKVMVFGLGGVFVEVMKDVVFRRLPLSRADAAGMLDEIKGRAVLDGVRGGAAVDREALVALMLQLSGMALAHPEVTEIDLNPVIVGARGCTIVDARILLG